MLAEALASHDSGRERLRRVLRGYAVAIASEFGWCMVRAADQDLGAAALGRRSTPAAPASTRASAGPTAPGIEDGSLGAIDPKMTAFAIAGALNWIAHWHRQDDALSPEAIAAQFIDFFERGLLPRSGEPGPGSTESKGIS